MNLNARTWPRTGIVGTGRMGANMARRLHDCGVQVVAVFDRQRSVSEALAAELGCLSTASPSEVSEAAEVIITVVTDDTAMRNIFGLDGGSGHLLEHGEGRLFLNCATVTPSVHSEVEDAVRSSGGESLEVCMASSITQAREGSLYLMVGGSESAVQKAEPLLSLMSSSLRHVGPTGRAAQVKALVNMVMNINTAGLAEGLGLGAALGLDLDMLREVFAQTGAASRVLQTDGEDMQHRDHACFFSAAHAAKDSGIALALGAEAGLSLPLAQATAAQFRRMVDLGLGELDKSGVAELTFRGRMGACPKSANP